MSIVRAQGKPLRGGALPLDADDAHARTEDGIRKLLPRLIGRVDRSEKLTPRQWDTSTNPEREVPAVLADAGNSFTDARVNRRRSRHVLNPGVVAHRAP